MSTSKAVRSLITSRNGAKYLIRSPKDYNSKFDQIRCYNSIVGISTPSVGGVIDRKTDFSFTLGSLYNKTTASQKTVSWLRRRGGRYSPEQLFDVVAAVDLYHGFVPWCQRSEILRRHPDGSFDAELEIGFKYLVESYVSHVELNRPKSIKTTVSESTLFDHLINIWEFNPGPVPGTCDLFFLVDFKFQSPLYRQVLFIFPFQFFFIHYSLSIWFDLLDHDEIVNANYLIGVTRRDDIEEPSNFEGEIIPIARGQGLKKRKINGIKEETAQTRKRLGKLDTIEGLLTSLVKDKSTDRDMDIATATHISFSLQGEASTN
ncbi:hypothetical protein GH714_013286 [Hevea brasiliensis]|uniref:Coenzyme Q-binding protein COQ10 START domain-containing protein n=1 Tax=Hevea brasiliensis TaxID=3981 RepID=A0A6A6NGV8_HEVBR|nr:hypothetical protein GH714_013286 [Hevea brasiliensis]